jgi:hypothetical protein
MSGPTESSDFKHTDYCFPLFLPYEYTTPLGRTKNPLWSNQSKKASVEQRDLNPYMVPTSNVYKKQLELSGFDRKMPFGSVLKIEFKHKHKQTFVVFDPTAVFPNARYIMNSGEVYMRNGKLILEIKVQKRNKFESIFLFA